MPAMTVSPEEVARFDALAARWWDPNGPMRPLHRMNSVRVRWIVERLASHRAPVPLPAGCGRGAVCAQIPPRSGPLPQRQAPHHVLDVGCGAGLAAEALARHGFSVLGLDAAAEVIGVARAHAALQGLPLAYRIGVAENLLAEKLRFPAITALEVIEHVPDPAAFLRTLRDLLEPGGQLFLSTLNRTPASYLAAKIAAEYLLHWLPVGTHDWGKFIKPVELGAMLRRLGLRVTDLAGLLPELLTGRWHVARVTSVNYILAATI